MMRNADWSACNVTGERYCCYKPGARVGVLTPAQNYEIGLRTVTRGLRSPLRVDFVTRRPTSDRR